MTGSHYDAEFHEETGREARRSAQRVVPIVLEYVQPTSVIDVGCGTGAWLAEFQNHGVSEILGIDGDYVDREALLIPEDRFRAVDLSEPFELSEKADLVVCLEVVEHLTEEAGEHLIEILTQAAPVVLFSAAIPGQGGTHHINEQWPDYWAERFQAHDFVAVDCLRDRIWDDDGVAWYYAQNMMFFVDEMALRKHSALAGVKLSMSLDRRLHQDHPASIWVRRGERAREAVLAATERGEVILVDDGKLSIDLGQDRPIRSLMEVSGVDWGSPENDEIAMSRVRALMDEGVRYLAITFPAFWWFDAYPGLSRWLQNRFEQIWRDDQVVVFDLWETPSTVDRESDHGEMPSV